MELNMGCSTLSPSSPAPYFCCTCYGHAALAAGHLALGGTGTIQAPATQPQKLVRQQILRSRDVLREGEVVGCDRWDM